VYDLYGNNLGNNEGKACGRQALHLLRLLLLLCRICDDRPERGGAELASLLSLIPSDRLMIETDAPYLVSLLPLNIVMCLYDVSMQLRVVNL
jgi:hypothetical protein